MSSSYDSAVVDTAMIEDPRLLVLPRSVRLLHLEAIVWSKARLTDGFIPSGSLRRLTDEPSEEQAAAVLVYAGLWETVEGGWQIVGFTDTQMSAERVRELRAAARIRYDSWRKTHKRVGNGADNGAARPPAPPARKGGGQRVEEASGEAIAGAPSPPLECVACRGSFPEDELLKTSRGLVCVADAPKPPKMSRCRSCGLYFLEKDGHECQGVPSRIDPESVEGRHLQAVGD